MRQAAPLLVTLCVLAGIVGLVLGLIGGGTPCLLVAGCCVLFAILFQAMQRPSVPPGA